MSFLLDECITEPVARALHSVDCRAIYAPDIPDLGRGATDNQVYDYATANGLVVITQDRTLGQERVKQLIALGSGCGVFVLRRPKVDSKRLKLIRILTIWDELERVRVSQEPPYIFECRAQGSKLVRIR